MNLHLVHSTGHEKQIVSDRGTERDEPGEGARALIASAFSVAHVDPGRAEERLRAALEAAPEDPTVQWALGRFLHDVRGDVDGAESAYRRALEIDPCHPKALGDYARLLHYLRRDLDAAEAHYERAVDAAPSDAETIADLAYFVESARGDHERAEGLYEQALEIDPDAAEILDSCARFFHHQRRDAERAREAYRRAIEAAPARADLRAWNAVFLQTLGADPDGARAAFEQALEIDPAHGFALSNFALFSWSHDHDLDRAEELFARALTVEPDRWSTHWWCAAFLDEARGSRLRAAQHYRRAVELQPAHSTLLRQYQRFLEGGPRDRESVVGDEPHPSEVDAISDRGYRCEEKRNQRGAEAAYREALAADPDHGPTLRRFASLLESLGRLDDAEEHLRRAVELAPRDGWAHGLIARFLTRHRGDLEGADEHYRLAISAGLHDPKWLGEYARFLANERGQRERAKMYYERAMEAAPSPDVVIDHARFAERTRPADAEALYHRAVELAPDDAYPLRQLARFYEDVTGDYDEAEAQYGKAVSLAPEEALTLDAYARFLEHRREDDLRAARFYLRAARAEPDRATRWAVVVRFLLERDLAPEATGSLRRWIERAGPSDEFATLAEASFCGLVYLPEEDERAACFERLKKLLAEGAQLGRWDVEPHLAFLRGSARPDAPWVERLAQTLTNRMG